MQPDRDGLSRIDAYRYRITFAKTIEMRYTSHLDVQRTWERLIRRAELPLLFTQGFHPRARFNLAAALPLGFIGEAEIAELYLVEDRAPESLAATLRKSAPPGIRIDHVDRVDPRAPAVQTEIAASDYTVRLAPEVDLDALALRVTAVLAADSVPRERRGKAYDLRPLIGSMTLDPPGHGPGGHDVGAESPPAGILRMTLVARDGATGRPDEVLSELGLDPLTQLVCRDRLVLESDS